MAVDFDRLADALTEYHTAFLISVGEDARAHTVMIDPVSTGASFDVGPVGDRTTGNIAVHADVSLLWPPRTPGGYALMVDGRAELTEGTLRVAPTKALLHRRAAPGSPAAETGCLHDCVVFKTDRKN